MCLFVFLNVKNVVEFLEFMKTWKATLKNKILQVILKTILSQKIVHLFKSTTQKKNLFFVNFFFFYFSDLFIHRAKACGEAMRLSPRLLEFPSVGYLSSLLPCNNLPSIPLPPSPFPLPYSSSPFVQPLFMPKNYLSKSWF